MRNGLLRRAAPFVEIVRAAWDNSDRPGYALRILRRGVCDGCALGTTGMRDWTMPDLHLCWIRLNLLRLNTVPPFEPEQMQDVERLAGMSEAELRKLGRIPQPFVRHAGQAGFTPIAWDEALGHIAARCEQADPRRVAFYLVSRGTVNETYYVVQKAARLIGTNHIDNSARICHAPSTTALKHSLGLAATTCSYSDMIGTDLIVFVGSDAANNQPVVMKYLHKAKKQGTKIAVINPFREPGMDKYFVPSTVESVLFGSNVCDAFFNVRVGGDIAFVNGVLKCMIADGTIDHRFVDEHTTGWDELERSLAGQSFEELERLSGATRESMQEFARLYGKARSAVFVWSMGLTMHRHGVDNVKSVINLGLARGNVGREKAGLMPIRGHSGVQGGAEMGCVPNVLPGGHAVDEQGAALMSRMWGFEVPSWRGHFVSETVDAAHRGELDVLYCVGSNLFNVLPDTSYVRAAIGRIPLRIHHDLVLNPQMFVDPAETVLVLPATTRYEMEGGNTETSTERRVIFNPEIPGPRVAHARDEWQVIAEIAARVRPEHADKIRFASTAEVRDEIGQVVPFYDGIQSLSKQGDQFQWGGAMLGRGGDFPLPGGRARFVAVEPPQRRVPEGRFTLSTRRGKQFNSIVMGEKDMITGTGRDAVMMAAADMQRLGLSDGDPVTVRSETGELAGHVREAKLTEGTVSVYWPEANAIIPRGVADPECGIPAYRDAIVEVVAAR